MEKVKNRPDKKVYRATDYGAVPDGITLNTDAVQKAIDACSENGGGKVVFGKGEYVLSTVFLKSNVEIYMESGATILGSTDFYDYQPDEKVDYPLYQDASHSFFNCALFVGRECENISIHGAGVINMRSVWDEDETRNMAYRGAKCISLKQCKNVALYGFALLYATDLAIYFAGCENVEIYGLKIRTYIDGISPDNSKNVRIHDCEIESGDDSIVLKSSYNLNKIDYCENIRIWNCKIKSRAYCVKLGTESNGGFKNVFVEGLVLTDTRICGLAVESADGAIVDNVNFKNVKMTNVNAPVFVHVGRRMRGPDGREIGKISNVTFENISASGPYGPYEIVPCYYPYYKNNDWYQDPKIYSAWWGLPWMEVPTETWQFTSNVCGLKESPLENITFKNVNLELTGGVSDFESEVPENANDYPEVFGYGRILPAKGIYFRYVNNLILENVTVKTIRPDKREDFVFEQVENIKIINDAENE